MKKIKLLIILLIPLLLLTGCGDDKGLEGAIKKTSIKEKGLKSYRCKVNYIEKDNKITYIVLNNGNKDYSVNITEGDNDYSYELKDNKFIGKPSEVFSINYDYHDTDKFLDSLRDISDIKESKEKIDNVKYTKYSFKINKASLNKLLSSFDSKTKKDGKGYVYVDKDDHIYIINYESGKINLNVSYTRYNDVK